VTQEDGLSIAEHVDRAGVRLHFVGVAGTGMSALAQYLARGPGTISGSDRSLDRGDCAAPRSQLERAGIALHPQDGSGVAGAGAVVASTAVESTIPDLVAAQAAGVAVIHRAALLAELLRAPDSIAVAGTSGKSTVVAMIFEILAALGRDPGLITGGPLSSLAEKGLIGNAWRGTGPLVAEADESDGSLVEHRPEIGVLLNQHLDHMEIDRVHEQFQRFRGNTRGPFLLSDDPGLADLRPGAAHVFGFGPEAGFRGIDLRLEGAESRFEVEGVPVRVPFPGTHNAANALAALAATTAAGLPLREAAAALATCRGVRRRFESVGLRGGVTVIDDYAHNPAKIEAALRCATTLAPRVFAFFQPHGFGPTRFLRRELVAAFAAAARPADELFLGEIYYAGGTVTRDISAADLVDDLRARGLEATFLPDRHAWAEQLGRRVRPGDLVLIMGARDPSLDGFGTEVLAALPDAGFSGGAQAVS
jgi:UDP-N-acetylmuramate--alanine ligase